MRNWICGPRTTFRPPRRASRRRTFPALERLDPRCLLDAGAAYAQTALVADIKGLAPNIDPNLVNPWGVVVTPEGRLRVADNGTGLSTKYDAEGETEGKAVVILPPPGSPAGTTAAPDGAVRNTTDDFMISRNNKSAPATVLFSTEDGTIAGWNPEVD
jgi:hypothetical protein